VFVDLDDVDEFVDLLADLVETFSITRESDGHSGELWVASLRDYEGIDVVSSACKDLRNAHEDTSLVVNEDREGVNLW